VADSGRRPLQADGGCEAADRCLNFTVDEPWHGIAEGFKRIADLAAADVEQLAFAFTDYAPMPSWG
jgi:hypothetical protein